MSPLLPCLNILPYFILCQLGLGLAVSERSPHSLFPRLKGALKQAEVFSTPCLDIVAVWLSRTSSLYFFLACGFPSQGYLMIAQKVLAAPFIVFIPGSRIKEGVRAKGPIFQWSLSPLNIFPRVLPSDFWFYLIGYPNLQGRPGDIDCHF